jgi:hypothetical protein
MHKTKLSVLRRRLACAAFACVLFAGCGAVILAQNAAPKPPRNGRYLLVFDVSRPMRPLASSLRTNVLNLLGRDMNEQLRAGDTVGVWTFNERVYDGQVPLQVWSPQTKDAYLGTLSGFLKKMRYEKKMRFDALWKELLPLIKGSDEITVVLFTSGEDKLSGTPYDSQINTFFEDQHFLQKKKSLLFIVMLRAKHGDFLGGDVSLAAEQMKFPPFPPEPKVLENKPPAPAPAPAPPKLPPFVMEGTKIISAPRSRLFERPDTNTVTNVNQIEAVSNAPSETGPVPPAMPPPPASVDTNLAANPPAVPVVTPPAPSANQPARPDSAPSGADQPTNAAPPPTTAEPTPPKTIPTAVKLLIAGSILTAIVAGLIIFVRERSRSDPNQRIKIAH